MGITTTARKYYGSEAYTYPPLATGWSQYGAPWHNGSYFKDGNGVVHLSGMIKSTSTGTGRLTAFTLPEGYRPPRSSVHFCIGDRTVDQFAARVIVQSNGEVIVNGAPADNWLSLDNIQFHTDTSMFTEATLLNSWVNHTYPKIPRYTWFNNTYAGVHPANEKEARNYFRTIGSSTTYGGRGTHAGELAWGPTPNTANTKPGYLPTDQFAWIAEASFYCPTTGNYVFAYDSDDAGEVWIDDKLQMYWYGGHGAVGFYGAGWPGTAGATLYLTQGVHSIMVRMEEGAGGDGVAVGWQKPGDPGVLIMPYGNGTTTTGGLNYAADTPAFRNTAGYWKDEEGFVHLKGVVYGGADGALLFTLPPGYRPAGQLIQAGLGDGNVGRIEVKPDGSVFPVAGQCSSSWELSLDGIIFPCAELAAKYTPLGNMYNGWTAYGNNEGSTFNAPAWYKDRWGVVRLTGLIGYGTVGTIIGWLPAQIYNGSVNRYQLYGTVSNGVSGRVDISGQSSIAVSAPSSNAWVSLEPVKFRARNWRTD